MRVLYERAFRYASRNGLFLPLGYCIPHATYGNSILWTPRVAWEDNMSDSFGVKRKAGAYGAASNKGPKNKTKTKTSNSMFALQAANA